MKSLIIALFGAVLSTTVIAAELGEDGLHKTPWMAVTFKDMTEDLETAADSGKRLAIIHVARR